MTQSRGYSRVRRRAGVAAIAAALVTLAGCGGSDATQSADAGSDSSGGSSWQPTQGTYMEVPFAPGGGSDVFGRAMAQGFEQARDGLNMTVENRPAGSGAVGYSFLLSKEGNPNYLLASETTGVALPITTETPWTWEDFTPVMQVAADSNVLIVPADSPYTSLSQVVDALKQGTPVTMGLTGATSVDAIVTGLMEKKADVQFDRVIFQSGGEEVVGLLGGSVDMAMLNPSEVIGQIKAGTLKGLAVFADQRYDQAPLDTIPTAKEAGVDVSFVQYRGVFAAGGITDAQEKYWEQTVKMWTDSPEFTDYVTSNYLQKVLRPHDEFTSYLKDYEQTIQAALKTTGRD